MKKLISVLLVLVLASALSVSCGKKNETADTADTSAGTGTVTAEPAQSTDGTSEKPETAPVTEDTAADTQTDTDTETEPVTDPVSDDTDIVGRWENENETLVFDKDGNCTQTIGGSEHKLEYITSGGSIIFFENNNPCGDPSYKIEGNTLTLTDEVGSSSYVKAG